MVKNEAEAEDLTQEAFLRVFRKIHTFQGKSAFSTWLHRVSVNTVLMSLRKKKRVEISLENDDHYEEEPGVPRQIPGSPDPSLIGLFDRENLKRVFRQMPDGYKTDVSSSRCAGVRTQRDRCACEMLGGQFQVAIAQGPRAHAHLVVDRRYRHGCDMRPFYFP